MYRAGKGEESVGDTLDPGLVMTGTKCGDNAVRTECLQSSVIVVTRMYNIVILFVFCCHSYFSEQICFGGECRNASFLQTDECKAKCHGRGVGGHIGALPLSTGQIFSPCGWFGFTEQLPVLPSPCYLTASGFKCSTSS